jgi:hypothetical protein
MFDAIEEVSLDPKKYQLVHLFQSLNQPQISPGAGLVAQTANASLMVVKSSAKGMEIFVGLFFPDQDQRVLYHMPVFSSELIEEKLSLGEAFLGQMGFLMDNMHFQSASVPEKKELIRTLPFFYSSIEAYYQALDPNEIEAKKGKTEIQHKKDAVADHQIVFLEHYLAIMSML